MDDAQWLYEQHWINNLSCKDIGLILNVDADTVRRHMHKLNIPTKNNAQSKIGLMVGDKHPNWQGGASPLKHLLREYFNTNIAPLASKRDGYTCQLCGKQHTILHVHHIESFNNIVNEILNEHPQLDQYDNNDLQTLYNIIINDKRFTNLDNLITYCKDCHYFKIHKYQHKKTISSQASMLEEGSETIP